MNREMVYTLTDLRNDIQNVQISREPRTSEDKTNKIDRSIHSGSQ